VCYGVYFCLLVVSICGCGIDALAWGPHSGANVLPPECGIYLEDIRIHYKAQGINNYLGRKFVGG
jgi:hypothetical protein